MVACERCAAARQNFPILLAKRALVTCHTSRRRLHLHPCSGAPLRAAAWHSFFLLSLTLFFVWSDASCTSVASLLIHSFTMTTSSPNGVPLLVCAVGICASYLYYGMLQERLFSDAQVGASFLLLTQCVTNTIVALTWQRVDSVVAVNTEKKDVTSSKTGRQLHHPLLIISTLRVTLCDARYTQHPTHPASLVSSTAAFCYFVAMAASNESLRYVTYPTAVLAKSSKLIPTMVLGCLVERRSYNHQEWLAAACITSGVILFNLSRNTNSEEEKENSWYGILLLVLSLIMDGMLGACQGLLKSYDTPPTATETMLYVNLYATFFFIPLSILTQEWSHGWQLLQQNPEIQQSILWLNCAAAAGQIFIFLTITWYSSLICTTITTTRKFFTILLSVVHFGHVFTSTQWMSVGLVFFGLYTGIFVSKARIATPMKQKGE